MTKYDFILWDWNGTLVDDLNQKLTVINNLLSKRGLPVLSREQYRDIFKFPIIEFYRKAGFTVCGQDYENLVSDYQTEYSKQMDSIKLMPKAEVVLKKISGTKTKQLILSASTYKAILEQMERYNISELFTSIISLSDAYAKGKLDLARRWLDSSGANPRRVLIIGDTLHDYEIAMAMKFDCLLINNGHQDLLHFQSKYTCKCLTDILQVLDYI